MMRRKTGIQGQSDDALYRRGDRVLKSYSSIPPGPRSHSESNHPSRRQPHPPPTADIHLQAWTPITIAAITASAKDDISPGFLRMRRGRPSASHTPTHPPWMLLTDGPPCSTCHVVAGPVGLRAVRRKRNTGTFQTGRIQAKYIQPQHRQQPIPSRDKSPNVPRCMDGRLPSKNTPGIHIRGRDRAEGEVLGGE